LPCWLIGWWFGEKDVGSKVLQGQAGAFEFVWLVGWTVAGFACAFFFLRSLFGSDILLVRGSELSLNSRIFGVGFTRVYSITSVHNLRFTPGMTSGRSRTDSSIAFDYGAKTVRFARGIEEAEANALIRLIRDRASIQDFPTYTDYSDPRKPDHTWLKLS